VSAQSLILAFLPALLVPHVHTGEQLRYGTMNGAYQNFNSYTIASVSPASISWTGSPGDLFTFAYNAALLGKPPQLLDTGAHWSNTVYGADWIDFWSVTVADIQPKSGLVRLHLTLVRRKPSTDQSFYEEQAGDMTFVNGVMTNVALKGYLTATALDGPAPYYRQDASYNPSELQNSAPISRRLTLIGTIP
jgi:hypothetical protein